MVQAQCQTIRLKLLKIARSPKPAAPGLNRTSHCCKIHLCNY